MESHFKIGEFGGGYNLVSMRGWLRKEWCLLTGGETGGLLSLGGIGVTRERSSLRVDLWVRLCGSRVWLGGWRMRGSRWLIVLLGAWSLVLRMSVRRMLVERDRLSRHFEGRAADNKRRAMTD